MPVGRVEGALDRGDIYPNPFLNIANTWMPASIRELFYWMEFFYATNPEAHRLCYDLASFPITELSVDDEDEELANTYRDMFQNTLDMKSFLVKIGIDYHVYGNSFAFILFPFTKYLTCEACKDTQEIKAWKWKVKKKRFAVKGECPACKAREPYLKVTEVKDPDRSRTKLVRWSPLDMELRRNSVSDELEYHYNPPVEVRRKVLAGDKFMVETTPQVIVEAIWNGRKVKPNPQNFFHFRTPSPSGRLSKDGWGIPVLLTVMKLLYYLGVLRRGSEAVALEHVAPMRIVFPMSQGGMNPVDLVGMRRFANQFEEGYRRFRRDPNHVITMPFPVGIENFGGDANALLITPEIEMTRRSIATGLGVPIEFLDGTMSWSGSSVSLRVLGNRIINYMRSQKRFMRFCADRIGVHFGLDPVDQVDLTDFKMADDPQKMQLLTQLNSLGFLSTETLLREVTGREFSKEVEIIRRENEVVSELQEEKTIAMAVAQAKAQVESQEILEAAGLGGAAQMQDMGGDPMAGGGEAGLGESDPSASMMGAEDALQGGGMDEAVNAGGGAGVTAEGGGGDNVVPPEQVAYQYARRLVKVEPQQREQYLVQLSQAGYDVEMIQMIKSFIAQLDSPIDMRPLPEQRAPRRKGMNG